VPALDGTGEVLAAALSDRGAGKTDECRRDFLCEASPSFVGQPARWPGRAAWIETNPGRATRTPAAARRSAEVARRRGRRRSDAPPRRRQRPPTVQLVDNTAASEDSAVVASRPLAETSAVEIQGSDVTTGLE